MKHVCDTSVTLQFVVFVGVGECVACGAGIGDGDLGIIAVHGDCGHRVGYCERCALFHCMLDDARHYGTRGLASRFFEWTRIERAEFN